ncbi:hypothetical protein SDC9_186226 [bioreactor metagenome]|uniref:Uncharacterized protein n=1 Tax=bioreactor metagenome TaxID=1076179 RepID=A0A645HI45_9ZZZZ
MQNVQWPMSIVPIPRANPIFINIIRSATAITISGTIIGMYSILFMNFFPLNSYFFNPNAPIVPMATEITVANTAITIEYQRLPITAELVNNFEYHWVVKPFQ